MHLSPPSFRCPKTPFPIQIVHTLYIQCFLSILTKSFFSGLNNKNSHAHISNLFFLMWFVGGLLNSNVQVHFRFSLYKVCGVQNSTASGFPGHHGFLCQLSLHCCSILHLLPEANTISLFEVAEWRDSNSPRSFKSNSPYCILIIKPTRCTNF